MILAELLLNRSAPEAAALYNSIRAIAVKPLRQARLEYHDGQPPMDFIDPKYTGDNADNEHTRRFWQLNAGSFARVVTAVRLWFAAFDAETMDVVPASPAARERARFVALQLASNQLAAMQRADERRAKFLADGDK